MPATRAGGGRRNASSSRTANYQQKKAARERLKLVHHRVEAFVRDILEPGLRSISDELDWPINEVRQLAHLALPALVQQRQLSLWQAVMRIARTETSDWDSAIASAQSTYAELQRAIESAEWDDPLLVEYEQLRDDMEQGRRIKHMPRTSQQTVRAKLGAVARCHKEIDEKLQILSNTAGVEFFVVITTGDKLVKFAPFVSATRKVADFLPFKFKTTADQFATEMEGFALFGSEAYRMLTSKDPQHKAQVSKLLTEQLRTLTGDTKVTLRWKESTLEGNYDCLGVSLIGWPEDITFRPLMFLASSQARRLHRAIRSGSLRFEKQTVPTYRPAAASTTAPAAGTRRRQAGASNASVTQQTAPQLATAGSLSVAQPSVNRSSDQAASAQALAMHPSPAQAVSRRQTITVPSLSMAPESPPAPVRFSSITPVGPSPTPTHYTPSIVESDVAHSTSGSGHPGQVQTIRRGTPSGQMAASPLDRPQPLPPHFPPYPYSPMHQQALYSQPPSSTTQYLPIDPPPLPPPPSPPFNLPSHFVSPHLP